MSALIELLIKLLEKLLKTTQVSRKRRRRRSPSQDFKDGALTAFLAFEIILFSLLIAYSIVRIP